MDIQRFFSKIYRSRYATPVRKPYEDAKAYMLFKLGRRSRDLYIHRRLTSIARELKNIWPEDYTEVPCSWALADSIYMMLRDRLGRSHHWRFGVQRQPAELKVMRELCDGHVNWEGLSFLDLGCGARHPFGISALVMALGAERCFATDMQPITNEKRSAIATADLIGAVLLDPHASLGDPCPELEVICRRMQSAFDPPALMRGDLFGGIRQGLEHRAASFFNIEFADNSFALSHSHTVLEHIHDMRQFVEKLHRITSPWGYSFHLVDNRDHRVYENASLYKPWSFLLDEKFDDGTRPGVLKLCNRLRYSDYLKFFEEGGFEIVATKPSRETMPRNLLPMLDQKFKGRSDDDLDISVFSILLRKPAGA